jgi:hypothetical protein
MSEALTFKTPEHLLHAVVHGKLGESFASQLVSQACLRMVHGTYKTVEDCRLPETRALLKRIEDANVEELHELMKRASFELSRRAQVAAMQGDDPTPRIGGTADHGAR